MAKVCSTIIPKNKVLSPSFSLRGKTVYSKELQVGNDDFTLVIEAVGKRGGEAGKLTINEEDIQEFIDAIGRAKAEIENNRKMMNDS